MVSKAEEIAFNQRPLTTARSFRTVFMDRSLQFFSSQADELFDHVGDVFFDLAETSEDNEVQSMYFDAIKTVRNERAEVSGRWLNAISSAFDSIGSDQELQASVRYHFQRN